MNQQKVVSMLGFAQKAGKIASGDQAVENAVKSGKARLLLIAADASDNTRKSYRDMATYYQTDYREGLAKDLIGNAIGKPPRAAAAILDPGFAKAIKELLLS